MYSPGYKLNTFLTSKRSSESHGSLIHIYYRLINIHTFCPETSLFITDFPLLSCQFIYFYFNNYFSFKLKNSQLMRLRTRTYCILKSKLSFDWFPSTSINQLLKNFSNNRKDNLNSYESSGKLFLSSVPALLPSLFR